MRSEKRVRVKKEPLRLSLVVFGILAVYRMFAWFMSGVCVGEGEGECVSVGLRSEKGTVIGYGVSIYHVLVH